jgi:hypothetical protein
MSLFDLLNQVGDEIPGLKLTSVVEIDSGMPLVSVGPTEPLAAQGADAYHSDLYRVVARAMEALDAPQRPESFVLRGESSVFISIPFPDLGYFWHVVTETDVTIGFTQALMRKHAHSIEEGLGELLG